ncbi:hypothetical protein E2C00_29135 [Streptomyces sp. WAC05374]|uniref:hypothetical protein n=1 Tax=Streptomyces sp. WAC05374 TaxID=2487420 RepID=UPI000F894299|nr:hypothetical protein [Streptomyces sp. WAC05374]RST18623.1 hypothetical protein EF905_04585 [Streptomyces sp. WAC05374]TDF40691.1 hypothetical protein E2B92_23950 [Streptomyces sp. WAC05374]TDF49400.1 hypothetical protein E2C00_29135 [Streptomyces sp. WAC05374]TDF49907.1 hypothetical protein E2C02_25565 [Streptomyces sp. WAC05374]
MHSGPTFHLTEVSATHWRRLVAETGALVVGRKLFGRTGGWEGDGAARRRGHPLRAGRLAA